MKKKPKRCYTRLIDLIGNVVLFLFSAFNTWKDIE